MKYNREKNLFSKFSAQFSHKIVNMFTFLLML